MAYMTRHWLLGDRKQNSHYRPLKVALQAAPGQTEWETANKVTVVLTALKPNGDFSKLMLDQSEVDDLVAYLMRAVSPGARNKIINSAVGLKFGRNDHKTKS